MIDSIWYLFTLFLWFVSCVRPAWYLHVFVFSLSFQSSGFGGSSSGSLFINPPTSILSSQQYTEYQTQIYLPPTLYLTQGLEPLDILLSFLLFVTFLMSLD